MTTLIHTLTVLHPEGETVIHFATEAERDSQAARLSAYPCTYLVHGTEVSDEEGVALVDELIEDADW